MIERLAPRMVSSKKIGGNPRLIKRFMNSLSVRDSLAKAINAPSETNQEVLAKILLLQRCGEKELVNELQRDVLRSPEGRSPVLGYLERNSNSVNEEAIEDEAEQAQSKTSPPAEFHISELWSQSFAKEWLVMEPMLAGIDLRPAFHVSRGADEVFSQAVKLCDATRELLDVLREKPQVADQFREKISDIPGDEVPTVMNALVNHLRNSSRDNFTDVVRCCVTFETIHASQSSLLKSTLLSMDPNRWTAGIAPIIANRPWAREIHKHLEAKLGPKSPTVKNLAKAMEK